MSYNERRVVGSLISSIVVAAIFFVYVVQRFPQGNPYSPEVFHFWGSSVFIIIPVSIVASIITEVIAAVAITVATQENPKPLSDERDKLIQLRALRNSIYLFVVGFTLAMLSLVVDMPPSAMFIILFVFGYASGIFGYLTQLYLYRRGF